ncbi:MAG: Translation initiation factor [Ramlibacter sp.]|jgi:uncharacterized protein YraI|nr:Translation initiation factor [Ramlibacter sp.]
MNIKHLAMGAVTTALVAVSSGAQAQQQLAVTARPTNLRAGPATDYPVVAVLPGGFALAVQGCLPEYTWCDVVAGQSRGWMAAGNINYYYQNSYVPLSNYGAVLGIGALGFVLNDYWGSHYRGRSFYRDRSRWEGRQFSQPRGYVPPQRPGFIDPRGERPGFTGRQGERFDRGARIEQPRAAAPQPPVRAQRPAGPDPQSGSSQPNPRVTRQEQRQLNQGGSSSVDPALRPQY